MTRRELLGKAAEKTCTNREDTFPQIAQFWGGESGDNGFGSTGR